MPVTRKFWVANNILSPWDSSNWSYLSGGPAGAPVPGSSDIAVFDSSSIGSCLTSSEVNIAGLELQWGFHSSVIQGPYPMTIGLGNMILDGGVFTGASHDITVMGSFYLTASEFKSTQGILDVRNEFYYYDTTVVPENLTEIYSDEFPLTALDIQNKYITLDPAKIDDPTGNVAVNIVGGGSQYNGVDYFIDENLLRWDGMELEGKLIEGDILRVIYDRRYEPGSFYHCNGKVKIRCTGNRMHGGGAHFYDLEFSDIEHQINALTTIDSSCYVSHYLFLSSGGGLTEGNDATIFISGDMTGASTFGSLSRQNNALIDMTSSRVGASPTQRIFWEDGAVFPSLIIDKHNPAELPYRNVRAIKDQTGDLIFSSNVTIHDGTFNLCGHNLRVGILNV